MENVLEHRDEREEGMLEGMVGEKGGYALNKRGRAAADTIDRVGRGD